MHDFTFSAMRPYNTAGAIELLRAAGVRPAVSDHTGDPAAWVDHVFSERNLDEALEVGASRY